MLKVNTVCLNGVGTSVILKLTVEAVLKEMGIDAVVESTDVKGIANYSPDVIVTSPEYAEKIGPKEPVKVVTVTNFVDKENMRSALQKVLI